MEIKLHIQSESALITNSSSEIFCTISSLSEDSIKMVQEYLNSFLPYNVEHFPGDNSFTVDDGSDYN